MENQLTVVNLIFFIFPAEIFEFRLKPSADLDGHRGTWTGYLGIFLFVSDHFIYVQGLRQPTFKMVTIEWSKVLILMKRECFHGSIYKDERLYA